MTEITVLSGKGGSGKTSISAAFATIAKNIIVADCDVDAANMHLILNPTLDYEELFTTGYKAIINDKICVQCGICIDLCRFEAIANINGIVTIKETTCDGCKLCSRLCPTQAISMMPSNRSKWFKGTYRNGLMVHARLAPGEENSGKLVNIVRSQARKMAEAANFDIIVIDGPPGIGCPVISSMTGAKKVVIVTEPSKSGFHDLKRVLELTANFSLTSCVIINKYDLNTEMSSNIEQFCKEREISMIGKIPFDPEIVHAMVNCKSIIEWNPLSDTSLAIHKIWERVLQIDSKAIEPIEY